MKRHIIYTLSALATLLFVACNGGQRTNPEADFIATIQPIKFIIEQISGDDFQVDVLVPNGASPETFEPTPKQFIALNEAKLVFSTGLIDFESALTESMHDKNSLVNLSNGIELIEGRDYMPEDEQQDDKQLYIFNEKAQKEFGLKVNEDLNGATAIGFCKDFKFRSLQYESSAFAFCVREHTGYIKHCYVRTAANADIEAVEKHIKDCVTKMGDNADKITIEFFDEELGRQYEKERELNRLITIFALISICISLMGVFGLVFFETQYRRREIALRRVHGAQISEILRMFVMQYARMVGVAFLFAVPVSYLIM